MTTAAVAGAPRRHAEARPPLPARARHERRAAVWLHRWTGLLLGLLLAVIGLSGSALVFRDEIDRALNPQLLVVAPRGGRRPLDQALGAVAARYPGEPAVRVRMPRRADASYEVWLGARAGGAATPGRYVYVDPYTARVLGARRPAEFLTGWLFELHAHLLSGELGHQIAGWAAWGLAALAASGLVAWWPGRRKLAVALTVARGRGARRRVFDLHRAGGFYVSALLLLSAVTGASLVFHEAFEGALRAAFRSPPPPPARVSTAPLALGALPVDSALAAAERALPGGLVSYVYLPTAPGQPVQVRKRRPGELHPNGKTMVWVDPRSNAVLAASDGLAAPAGARAYSALYPLHIGSAGGLPMRALLVAGGLAPAALLVSGVVMWRARRRGSSPASVWRRSGEQRAKIFYGDESRMTAG